MTPPKHWPEKFIYAQTSVLSELQPFLLELALTSEHPDDAHKIVPIIEQQEVHPHMLLQTITDPSHPLFNLKTKHGHLQCGVFATEKIPSGTVLGEYVGKIYLVHAEESLEEVSAQNPFSDYTWTGRRGTAIVIIDAQRIANELAFINDYRGLKNTPNVAAQWIAHRGRDYLVYITMRDVETGEELLISYGKAARFLAETMY
jgi:hypothetical protein